MSVNKTRMIAFATAALLSAISIASVASAKQPEYSKSYAEDRAEIEDLMARYLFAIDYQDWDAYVGTCSSR